MNLDYKNRNFNKSYKNDIENEINILQLLSHHQNSLKFYGSYDNNNEKILVLEKCDENLEEYMNNRNNASLNLELIKEIFNGLNKVFKTMQKEKIIHRDLKLKNLLVKYIDNKKDKFIVKLGDYGIGKYLNKGKTMTGLKGTAQTVAPEILLEKYENIEDIFSLGIILYQLSHNLKHPYNDNDAQRHFIYINYFYKDNFNITIDNSIKNQDFIDLLKKMLQINPKNRISWEEYFNHPFFK